MVSNTAQIPRSGRKNFVPLENSPGVMTSLIQNLGVNQTLEFQDVFSVDEPDLLAIVPRPTHALMLIFPISDRYEKVRKEVDAVETPYTGSGPDEPVMWYKQTINNACGLIALLHVASNGAVREHVMPGSVLDKLIKEATPLTPDDRADLLYNSPDLESAHASAAQGGSSAAPDASADIDLHFVAFVKDDKDGGLWELDGRRTGPRRIGQLGEGEDLLSDKALEATVRRFVREERADGNDEIRFSVLALVPAWQ